MRGELPTHAAIWAANHHSWWDYFVARAALRAAGRTDVGVLMDPTNIPSRKLFGWAGAVGSDRLRTAAELTLSGGVLAIFPEGQLRAPGPLGAVRPGAAWLARRTGATPLAVATRVVLRGHQAPEAYLDIVTVPAAAGLRRRPGGSARGSRRHTGGGGSGASVAGVPAGSTRCAQLVGTDLPVRGRRRRGPAGPGVIELAAVPVLVFLAVKLAVLIANLGWFPTLRPLPPAGGRTAEIPLCSSRSVTRRRGSRRRSRAC